MFKKILTRSCIGAFAAIVYSDLIAIFISFAIGDGLFHPVAIGFTKICSTEAGAVLFQLITMFIFGAIMGSSSLIFEKENWSLLKRTIIHFLILTCSFMIVALLGGYVNNTSWGIFSILSFVFIYAIIWIVIYMKTKKEIEKLNESLKNN